MKRISALAFLAALISSQAGATCAALDYQEMKEMPIEELVKEGCAARKGSQAALDDGIRMLSSHGMTAKKAQAQQSFDTCIAQQNRIERVLEARGIERVSMRKRCEQLEAAVREKLKESSGLPR